MPTISTFYGIVIRMFFAQGEHNPPHFHAFYGNEAAAFDIRTLDVLDGGLSPRATRLVEEWARKHQDELMTIWETQVFSKIPPLE